MPAQLPPVQRRGRRPGLGLADSYGTRFGVQANADTAVTGWQEVQVEFTPAPGNTTANVFAWFASHGDAWADDVSVAPKQANLL